MPPGPPPSTIPVLASIGIRRLHERDGSLDYGTSIMFFSLEKPTDGHPASVGNHVAFLAENRSMVDDFHRTALANGGSDAGAPGLRPASPAWRSMSASVGPVSPKIAPGRRAALFTPRCTAWR